VLAGSSFRGHRHQSSDRSRLDGAGLADKLEHIGFADPAAQQPEVEA